MVSYRKKKPVKRFKKIFNKYSHKKIVSRTPNVHFFKRTFKTSYTVTNSSFQSAYNITYELNDLPNYTEFTALYDTYKICGIKVKFVYDRNSATSQSSLTTNTIPNLLTVYDYNGNSITDENGMLQYPTFKIARMDKPITRYFRPVQTVDSSNPNYVKSRWNSTAEPDIVHRGLVACISNPGAVGDLGIVSIYATFYLAMKTPK